jgi:hypothetical protein
MKQKKKRDAIGQWVCGTAYRTACCGKFAAVCRSNRAQLDFSGMGPAATRGTARNVNAPVEIAGFDFSGTARYRTVSERYFRLLP